MTTDTIIAREGTVIQHGPLNDRVYLMKLGPGIVQFTLEQAEALAREHGYSKIFAKVPASASEAFRERGYEVEAVVPGFFNGREDGYLYAKYLDPQRREPADADVIEDVLATALARGEAARPCALPPGFAIRPAGPEDAEALATLYDTVFETYPFPIYDPGYIRETMQTHIRYYCAVREGRIVAASSAEIDRDGQNVEMTDFATHPSYRGMGLCSALLAAMEDDMQDAGMHTAYTIARAAMYPINITFARAGYEFGGTLRNNTNICGAFESMNVWYKRL
ncbi:MAG: putative beta-lysine N-acetyltransferase [Methanomicrobiaceae archaeon]|nr:putative beta-lysine N-acetyltransferase [Methanomicrobiaceae archaeon]